MFAGVDVVWHDNPSVRHINNGTVSFTEFHMPLSMSQYWSVLLMPIFVEEQ